MRNRSNFSMAVPFDHVYFLPCSSMSIIANSSIRFLNSLSLGHMLQLVLSRDLNKRLKSPHIIHGSSCNGFYSLICCRNSVLSAPVVGPYTPVILIILLSIISLRSVVIIFSLIILKSHVNMVFFHVRITPPDVPYASKQTPLSYLLPKIYLYIISGTCDNLVSCRQMMSGFSILIKFLIVDLLNLSFNPLTFHVTILILRLLFIDYED
jgi:hypothetical protein